MKADRRPEIDVSVADAWDVHPEGRVVLVLDPPYGLGKADWDYKSGAPQWYSMDFLRSLTQKCDSAAVILYGLDDLLIPLAAEIIANGRPHWRFCNLVDFVPDHVRQGMNQAVAYRLPRNSRALLLVYMRDPSVFGDEWVNESFPESMVPCLEFMREMCSRRGYTKHDLIRISGYSTCSHYLSESEFRFPDEDRFGTLFPDATDSEWQAYREARQAYREARQAYREARTPFRRPKISDGYVYHIDNRRDDTFGHPTAKQIGEIKPLLEVMQPSWRIVDPFCGSGMTARAAIELGRDCTLSDIDPHWVDITRNRVNNMMKGE